MSKITSNDMRRLLYSIMRDKRASSRSNYYSRMGKFYAADLSRDLRSQVEALVESGRTVRPCTDWTQRVAQLLSRDDNVIKNVSYSWWGPTNLYRIDDDKTNIAYWKTL